MPFYVAPEQFMKDKADYARTRIARGRPVAVASYDGGVLLAAENPSNNLFKIAEIYDRIGFAGVGRYNEFDQMRQAGVQHADVKGYTYSREDVDARTLANLYAQQLGVVFTHEMKPFEVEILVAEVGASPEKDQLFHILYDGTVSTEVGHAVMGGDSETLGDRMEASYEEGWNLQTALKALVAVLAGPDRSLPVGELEVAILDRTSLGRTFRRVPDPQIAELLE
ncbi:MAG: proteasome subunit alpha [Acidimicrobiales bacterium]|nr:proteasome subunit alpha [Acidimicrobiales bacterium]